MFCESESGWGEKLALEGGCSVILCEMEVSYRKHHKGDCCSRQHIGEQRKRLK